MLRGSVVGLVSAALLLFGCGDDDSGVSTANDQAAADEAIAAVEQSLRDDGFSPASDQDEDEDLAFESQECRELDEAFRIGTEEAAAEDQATVEFGGLEVEKLGSEGLGDAGGGFQLTGQVTESGVTVPISVAVQVVRVDRALVAIVTTAVGPDEPTVDRAALLQTLVDGVSDQSA